MVYPIWRLRRILLWHSRGPVLDKNDQKWAIKLWIKNMSFKEKPLRKSQRRGKAHKESSSRKHNQKAPEDMSDWKCENTFYWTSILGWCQQCRAIELENEKRDGPNRGQEKHRKDTPLKKKNRFRLSYKKGVGREKLRCEKAHFDNQELRREHIIRNFCKFKWLTV